MNRIFIVIVSLLLFSFIYKEKKFSKQKDYVFVPSGNFNNGEVNESIGAFWISNHEVTNVEYRFFLKDLKSRGDLENYKKALPDSSQWKMKGVYLEPYVDFYFSHPAYDNYPVVNISKEGAELYCEYLSKEYKKIYGNQVTRFRLPTRAEWMYAASSGNEKAIYPWGGPEVRNEDGDYMANFRRVNEYNIRMTENGIKVVEDSLRLEVFDDEEITYVVAPSVSYWPNEFGLYNTSGNVAEMVNEDGIAVGGDWHLPGYDIRISSTQKFSEPCPFVGFRPVMTFLNSDSK